jgi:hypothetical protein
MVVQEDWFVLGSVDIQHWALQMIRGNSWQRRQTGDGVELDRRRVCEVQFKPSDPSGIL